MGLKKYILPLLFLLAIVSVHAGGDLFPEIEREVTSTFTIEDAVAWEYDVPEDVKERSQEITVGLNQESQFGDYRLRLDQIGFPNRPYAAMIGFSIMIDGEWHSTTGGQGGHFRNYVDPKVGILETDYMLGRSVYAEGGSEVVVHIAEVDKQRGTVKFYVDADNSVLRSCVKEQTPKKINVHYENAYNYEKLGMSAHRMERHDGEVYYVSKMPNHFPGRKNQVAGFANTYHADVPRDQNTDFTYLFRVNSHADQYELHLLDLGNRGLGRDRRIVETINFDQCGETRFNYGGKEFVIDPLYYKVNGDYAISLYEFNWECPVGEVGDAQVVSMGLYDDERVPVEGVHVKDLEKRGNTVTMQIKQEGDFLWRGHVFDDCQWHEVRPGTRMKLAGLYGRESGFYFDTNGQINPKLVRRQGRWQRFLAMFR